jgi:hypothetical protein
MRVPIPRDDAEARALADTLNTGGWGLAGYLASRVTLDGEGQGTRSDRGRTSATSSRGLLSPREFAALGIRGLRSKDTVRLYVERWQATGLPVPTPGTSVTMPDLDWPPTTDYSRNVRDPERVAAIAAQAEEDDTGVNMAVKIAGSPRAMQAAIKADPATRQAAMEAIDQHYTTASRRTGNAIDRDAMLASAAREANDARFRLLDMNRTIGEWAQAGRWDDIEAVRQRCQDMLDLRDGAEALTPEMFQ